MRLRPKARRLVLVLSAIAPACGSQEDHGAWRAEVFGAQPEGADAEVAPRAAVGVSTAVGASTAVGVGPGFEETIHAPERLRGISVLGPDGAPVRVACATCHGMIEVELSERGPHALQAEVGGPHVGLQFTHGPLDCAHCHDPSAPSMLRSADGRTVPTTEALQLCAQCHGLQWTDFQHGAHGGMRGHWDLEAGPRERNHCVDCHDPHAPALLRYRPMPPPRDRFAPVPPHRAGHPAEGAGHP